MSAIPLAIGADHPAFEGHFPGQPIVPAVVLLAEALEATTARTATRATDWDLRQAKFVRSATPGEPLELVLVEAGGGIDFEVRTAGTLVASGRFTRRAA